MVRQHGGGRDLSAWRYEYSDDLNTGGIDNDGNTGVFMDLTSVSVEDVFKNGLAVKVDFSSWRKGYLPCLPSISV